MYYRHGFTLVELVIVIVIIGLLAVIAIPNYQSMQYRAKEAKVTSTAHTVQLAAEDFGVRNDGQYSATAADLTPLLPGAGLLENAFTGAVTEPRFGADATAPGEIGITVVAQGGVNSGYTITGWGKEALIMTLANGH